MNILKKYKVVIAVVLPIIVLVLIKALDPNHFKPDAKKWAEPSVLRSNLINKEDLVSLPGERLLINLDDNANLNNEIKGNAIKISPDSILFKNNLNMIRKYNGHVMLHSSDPGVSARIWMVLSQLGVKDIYILTSETDNEVFKHKFRPDSLIRPEL